MKGFGQNNNQKNNKKIINALPNEEKLISDAFKLHTNGNIKDASNIYIFLIKNGCKDLRVHRNLGVIYQQNRRFEDAKNIYFKVLKNYPNSPEVYSNLGKIFQEESEFQKATDFFKKAINLKPDYLIAYHNLINLYINLNKFDEAANILKKCTEIFPDDFNTLINYGCVLKELEEYEFAEIYLKKSIKLNPNSAIAHINLAAVQKDLKKLNEAEKNILKAIKLNPNSALAYNNFGNILKDKESLEEAEKNYRKAINLNKDFYLAYNNIGNLFSTKGDLLNAEKFTQKAIEINPKFELACVNLAIIKEGLNKIDEAESFYIKAIKINKNFLYSYISLWNFYEKTNNLEKLKNHLNSIQNEDSLKYESLLFKARISYREKDFDLAKSQIDQIPENWPESRGNFTRIKYWSFKGLINEKVKNFDLAYTCFVNSQKDEKYKRCDPNKTINYINEYRESLNSTDHSKVKKEINAKTKEKLVFLIGFPRSGTTLLDTILRSHHQIDVLEEKPLIYSVERIIKTKFKLTLNKIYYLKKEDLDYLRKHYLSEMHKYKDPDKKANVFVDKYPFQTACLPLINLLFPEAKIIFAHRNPFDTVLSCFQQTFEPNNAMANFTTLKSSAQIYDLTMQMWVLYKKNLKLDFIMSRYETLLDNFDDQINKILDFLDLEWDENIKNYRNTALKRGKINTPSSSQVVQPLYKTSIAKWKNYEKYFSDSKIYLDKWYKYFGY